MRLTLYVPGPASLDLHRPGCCGSQALRSSTVRSSVTPFILCRIDLMASSAMAMQTLGSQRSMQRRGHCTCYHANHPLQRKTGSRIGQRTRERRRWKKEGNEHNTPNGDSSMVHPKKIPFAPRPCTIFTPYCCFFASGLSGNKRTDQIRLHVDTRLPGCLFMWVEMLKC